jgi:hypothetical protein
MARNRAWLPSGSEAGGCIISAMRSDRVESAIRIQPLRWRRARAETSAGVAFDGRRIAWIYTHEKLLLEYLECRSQRKARSIFRPTELLIKREVIV